jgi:hypothetical protein
MINQIGKDLACLQLWVGFLPSMSNLSYGIGQWESKIMTGTNSRTFNKIAKRISAVLVACALAVPAMAKGLPADTSSKPAQVMNAPVQVGVVTATTRTVIGTSARKLERALKIGTRLIVGERIETGDDGRINVLFRDGSSITIGPNAALVIDVFQYDPKTKSGKFELSSRRGEFRFIGGRIAKKTPVLFKTPTATLGIKGGINQISIPASGDSVTTTHIFSLAYPLQSSYRVAKQPPSPARNIKRRSQKTATSNTAASPHRELQSSAKS